MKQVKIDPSNGRVLMGQDTDTLQTGFTAVTDAQWAVFVSATTLVYYSGGQIVPIVYSLADTKSMLSSQVDALVATIYSTWTRFGQEYQAREDAANAYKAAGYTGPVSVWIAAFATPAGLSPKAATDLILSQATMLTGALSALGALRMRKYEIAAAPDVGTANAIYTDITNQIYAVAAQIT